MQNKLKSIMQFRYFAIIFCILHLIDDKVAVVGCPESDAALHSISKRFVLFPEHSLLQITSGLSVPLILPRRSINLSLGFQINHEFPYNFSNFDPLYGRLNEDNGYIDVDRNTLYEYVIGILDSIGWNGEACLLRAICEASEVPLHTDDPENLLEQILHYLLTPSKDIGTFIKGNNTFEYKALEAEALGHTNGDCSQVLDCDISLLDIFSNKYEV